MIKTFTTLLLAVAATPAMAAPAATVSSSIRTADLDLSSAAGQSALDRRLSAAAIQVCGTAWDSDVPGKNEVRRCRAEVKARFMAERNRRIAAASTERVLVAAR